ncbi:MAG: phosphoenolpyruvate synthase [Myxococcaceae bacterium]
MPWVLSLDAIGLEDVLKVGGKNASLGEMIRELSGLGVRIPPGFAVTAEAYRHFLQKAGLEEPTRKLLSGIERSNAQDTVRRSEQIRNLILSAKLPNDVASSISAAYRALSDAAREPSPDVAVRSSATAEDLPTASFAGQHESFLNVRGEASLLEAVVRAYASLFSPRAISYRQHMGFDHFQVALSVGVQRMVRSDLASAGVIFTLDMESGHRGVVLITSSFGLGESVVQGRVNPDQFWVHKATLRQGFPALFRKQLGEKSERLVYGAHGRQQNVRQEAVPDEMRRQWSLTDDDVLKLARWSVTIEEHYTKKSGEDAPMDIEWAKDGHTGELFIVQARPETVHSQKRAPTFRMYRRRGDAEPIVRGLAVGDAVATGRARILKDPRLLSELQSGEILVTDTTDPDWEPIMKRAAGIITERGGRTSHAAIVARELGIPAIVGASGAMSTLEHAGVVTLSCAEGDAGFLYSGEVRFDVEEIDLSTLPRPHTRILLNIGSPEQALKLARLPSDGIGLARMEFIFATWVGIHPMALLHPEKLPASVRSEIEHRTAGYAKQTDYFVDRLSQGIATLAAAFHPRPVILRFSDFKTNEYARLLGGEGFEPKEENPMLGWRGASRYAHPKYRAGFLLEVAAVKRVRETLGLANLKVMVPFCRTPEEGRQVLEVMAEGGLERGKNGLEVYVMAEIPSNILLADDFSQLFDGFSIGSNDLTQLILGVDRDSTTVAGIFDERSPAVLKSCASLLETAHRHGRSVGICGQAPSDYPEFAAFLVEHGIDSISLIPDALARTTIRIAAAEQGPAAPGAATSALGHLAV